MVVSNAKNQQQQQQSDNILPQITSKGGQNNYQTVRASGSGVTIQQNRFNCFDFCLNSNFVHVVLTGGEVKVNAAVHDAVRSSNR